MPYYRILIWTKKRRLPFTGIRTFDSGNVNAVQNMVYKKAEAVYNSTLIDVEVQQLAKTSTAVQKFIRKREMDT